MASKMSTKPSRPIIIKMKIGDRFHKFVGNCPIKFKDGHYSIDHIQMNQYHQKPTDHVVQIMNQYQMSAKDRHGQVFFFRQSKMNTTQCQMFCNRDGGEKFDQEYLNDIASKLWEKVQIELECRFSQLEEIQGELKCTTKQN